MGGDKVIFQRPHYIGLTSASLVEKTSMVSAMGSNNLFKIFRAVLYGVAVGILEIASIPVQE